MQIIDLEQNSQEWLDARKGKITGSKAGDVITKRGNGVKIGVYKLIAERMGIDDDGGSPMERGHALEEEAIRLFSEQYGKPVHRVGFCISDEDPDIANSPDGMIMEGDKYTEGIDAKCLNAANHLKAWFEQEVPSDYEEQVLQYFIVNPDCQLVHVVFYDPRVTAKSLFWLTTKREDVLEEIEASKAYQLKVLADVRAKVESLTF